MLDTLIEGLKAFQSDNVSFMDRQCIVRGGGSTSSKLMEMGGGLKIFARKGEG